MDTTVNPHAQRIQKMNNTEFMDHLMTFGGLTGGLKPIQILQLVENGVDEIIEQGPELIKEYEQQLAEGKSRPIIHVPAWVEAAKEIKEQFELRRS